MKRKEIMKTLSISGLALVIASSMLLSGCGNTENGKEVKTTTEASEIKDADDTKKDSKEIAKADEKVSNETQVASGETETEEVKEDTKDSKGTEDKSDKSDKTDNSGSSNSGNSSSGNSNSGNSSSGNSGNTSNGGNSSNGNTSNGGNSNSGNTSNGGNTSGGTSSSTTPTSTHTHNWIPITQTIHHPAETKQEDHGHYETIVDQAAYDEEVPIMERHEYCKTCLKNRGELVLFDKTGLDGQQEIRDHIEWHSTIGEYSVQTAKETIQVGTQTVHHEAVTHEVWVPNIVTITIKEAWDEVVTVGYQCSECGATK